MQYAGKVSGKTQFSVVDVRFGFTVFCYDMFCSVSKCSEIQVRLVEDPDFRCRRCLDSAFEIDGKPCVEVQLADGKLVDVVENFVYVGDCVFPGVGCELTTIKRCRSVREKFRELLPF